MEQTYYQKNREKIRAQQKARHQQRKLEDPEYMEKRRVSDRKYHAERGGKEVRDAYNKKFQEDGRKEKKGPSRPIHNQEERKFLLENLRSVDEVIFFSSEPEFEELIKSLKPDIIIVGSDWKEKSTIKTYYDGELIFFDRMEEYSTTKTIDRCQFK